MKSTHFPRSLTSPAARRVHPTETPSYLPGYVPVYRDRIFPSDEVLASEFAFGRGTPRLRLSGIAQRAFGKEINDVPVFARIRRQLAA